MGTRFITLMLPDECLAIDRLAEQWGDGTIVPLRQLYDAATWVTFRRNRDALMARHPEAAYFVRLAPNDVRLADQKPAKRGIGRSVRRRDVT